MEKTLLDVIKQELKALGVAYEYRKFHQRLVYPFVVGEYSEDSYSAENGHTSGTMFLTLTYRSDEGEAQLTALKEQIKRHFRDFRRVTEEGTLRISYSHSLFLGVDVEKMARTELYLNTNYWEAT